MLDIETLSTDPHATVVSIGAVSSLGLEFYTRPNMDEQIRAGRNIKADTVAWWMSQSDEARSAFSTKEVSVREALNALRYFIQAVKTIEKVDEVLVWAKPPSFDCVILKTLYEFANDECPWGFRDERCFRTLIKIFPDVSPPTASGVAHNALDDARYQMQHLKLLLPFIEANKSANAE